MPELKTKPTDKNVDEFLKKIENPTKRDDSYKILNLMKEVTQEEPKMWGDSIIGFGNYHYKYASGREGEWFLTGFSPRKQSLTLYIMSGFEKYKTLLQKLGKYKTGKSCLYINKLQEINKDILKELVIESVTYMKKQYP
ncbi:MAG: DUF1801 domain-containing protein [Candidatus Hodarchaeota archaeon]